MTYDNIKWSGDEKNEVKKLFSQLPENDIRRKNLNDSILLCKSVLDESLLPVKIFSEFLKTKDVSEGQKKILQSIIVASMLGNLKTIFGLTTDKMKEILDGIETNDKQHEKIET